MTTLESTGQVAAEHRPLATLLEELQTQLAYSSDAMRADAVQRRHKKGYRSARENLADLCDKRLLCRIWSARRGRSA